MSPTVGALALGIGAAMLVTTLLDRNRRRTLSRRARSQLGLADDPDQDTTAADTGRRHGPPTTVMIAIPVGALLGVLTIGPIGVVAGLLPWMVARSIQRSRARRRAAALDAALAPALQLVIDQLRVGRTLPAALDAASESADEPLASILTRVVNVHQLGTPLADVLDTVAAEEENRHLSVIASAIGLHSRQGGSITEILATVVESIEEADRLRRDLLTLTADARLSANVLLAMPVGALIITSLLSPGYATPLINTPIGRLLSGIGLALGAIGVMWLRHLARPESA